MRRLLVPLLATLAGGCGAVEEHAPPPRPDVPPVERHGALKAATWQGLHDAEAAREARRLAAIRRLRRSRTVAGALRLALLAYRISQNEHARLTRIYAAAKSARLEGARAAELASVIGVLERLAAERRLTAGRLRPAFLILRRNTEFWRRAPMPAPGQRFTYGSAVFQYYPGRGIQLQPLASWGRANWLAGACVRAPGRRRHGCRPRAVRRTLDDLLALASNRAGFLAWEHHFDWGGGYAPWISGMSQATAISALSRGARALGERRWLRAARRALGAFRAPPPVGVAAGDHFLMYSFAPDLRIFNGELQAVNGIGEMARLSGDRSARRLFRRGERAVRSTVAASDTGAWSLYSRAGRESTLDYHRLVGRFLGDMCERTRRRTYCAAERRFSRYEREPTRIGIAPLRRLHARRATRVRFSLSKISDVDVRITSRRGLVLSRDLSLPHGHYAVDWTPPDRGRYELLIEAQGPSGPPGVERRTVRIVLPRIDRDRRRREGGRHGALQRPGERRGGRARARGDGRARHRDRP
jgi:D-glucuronyl C5-epimerase C-terminus